MSECKGRVPVTAKVDAEMRDRIDEEAERLGVYRAEALRLHLDAAVELLDDDVECPHCGHTLHAEL